MNSPSGVLMESPQSIAEMSSACQFPRLALKFTTFYRDTTSLTYEYSSWSIDGVYRGDDIRLPGPLVRSKLTDSYRGTRTSTYEQYFWSACRSAAVNRGDVIRLPGPILHSVDGCVPRNRNASLRKVP